MPRYSISNAPTEVVGLYAGCGVFRVRLGDIEGEWPLCRNFCVLYLLTRIKTSSSLVSDLHELYMLHVTTYPVIYRGVH